jgi:deoxycytidine triphosphate deaminase
LNQGILQEGAMLMLLNKEQIKLSIDNDSLISPFIEANIQHASYDLTLGSKCYVSANQSGYSEGIIYLNQGDTVAIPPNSIFFFETREKINLPLNLAGKLSLRFGYIRKGLIMPSQPQADPGYTNYLFGMIYNLSNRPVTLKQGEHIATIEFFTLVATSGYTGPYENFVFEQFVSSHISSSLDSIHNNLIDNTKKLNATKYIIGFGTFLLTIITIIIAIITAIMGYKIVDDKVAIQVESLSKKQNEIEQKLNESIDQKGQVSVMGNSQESQNSLLSRIDSLESKMKLLESELAQRKGF